MGTNNLTSKEYHHIEKSKVSQGDEDANPYEKINKIWSLMSCLTIIEAAHVCI